jgi:tRNA(Ile)-lysidine synthase
LNNLLKDFKAFIAKENLFQSKDHLLLAVSGGVDSVVLCELCKQAGYNFSIAHCNFQLRGEESLRDENFVRNLAQHYNLQLYNAQHHNAENHNAQHNNAQHHNAQHHNDQNHNDQYHNTQPYNVPFHLKHFNTETYAQQNKLSIQVAARNLRYAWFAELLEQSRRNSQTLSGVEGAAPHPQGTERSRRPGHTQTPGQPETPDPTQTPSNLQPPVHPQPLTHILTAHHANDNIETILMNFFKGTGLTGLRGILPKQGNIIRPLLFATKETIKQFAEENKLTWVEDSSNAQDKYTRNFIRHQLMPVITEMYPQAESNLLANIQRFRETEHLYRQTMDNLIKKLVEKNGEELHIPILKLKNTNAATTILYEILHPLNFTPKQT